MVDFFRFELRYLVIDNEVLSMPLFRFFHLDSVCFFAVLAFPPHSR